MEIFHTPAEMTAWAKRKGSSGKTIALVPTMGFFHEGHLSLMRLASRLCDLVVVSLFINPSQFGPNEDYEKYPRDFERDCAMTEKEGVSAVFAPESDSMYPSGFQTTVSVERLSTKLCGEHRPGHFQGVATVVCKLFNIVRPDCAVFGEKDFQQLAIIRQMALDLNMNVDIIGHPIVREADGLAMSSRNIYLDEQSRESGLCLSKAIDLSRKNVAAGVLDTKELIKNVRAFIDKHPGTEIDYISFVDNRTLKHVSRVDKDTLLALAVRVNNKVRLIDNGFLLTSGYN